MKVRPLLPTDLIRLLSPGKSFGNQAKTWSNLRSAESSLSLVSHLLGQWIFPRERRDTWIYRDEASIKGLVSARNRSGAEVWQIDYLCFTGEEEDICLSLLNSLGTAGGGQGIEKVFLRLPAESPLGQIAATVGFHTYAAESLYQLQSATEGRITETLTPSHTFSFRPQRAADSYRIYELYHLAIPSSVRRFEGATFGEWQKSREKSGKRERELVWEKEGSLLAWWRAATWGNTGQFKIMWHPQQEEHLDSLVAEILTCLKDCSPFLCVVPEFQGKLRNSLQARGFAEIARYSLLVKELLVKVPQPYPLPLQA